MKRSGFLFVLIFVLSACGPAPTAVATPDIQATTASFSNTMVAATLTAQPTQTPVPTITPTPVPAATATNASNQTDTPQPGSDLALTPTVNAAPGIAATPTFFEGTFALGNTADLTTATFLIVNTSGVKEIIVTITGTTFLRSQPVYYSYKVTGSVGVNIVYPAQYHVVVQIPNKRFMSIDFKQTNKDKTTLTVFLTKLAIHGP